ncbi:MAG TPA: hypothetical protein VLA49_04210 [Anaerolineales bacterium]|nr:hypothetical protein [Anaerolineales bacterium]
MPSLRRREKILSVKGIPLPALYLFVLLLASCMPSPASKSAPEVQVLPPTMTPFMALASDTPVPPTPTGSPTFTLTLTATSPPSLTPTSSPSPTPALPAGALSWEQARDHAGEQATVCGPVVDGVYASESQGKPTFLNLGMPYPEVGRFTVLIWGDDRASFPEPPEEWYFGKTICVSGEIEIYRGTAEIIVEQPGQIEVR